MIDPPRWSKNDFDADIRRAIALFRRERLEEPLDEYLTVFDECRGTFEDLLEATVDLTRLQSESRSVLGDDRLREAFRYLAGPPISLDDLKTVAATVSFTKKRLVADADLAKRTANLVLMALDRRRFPWVTEDREPTEPEKLAAIIGSAALIATQRVGTKRRHEGKRAQELAVSDELMRAGFKGVVTRRVTTLDAAPAPGEFCGESMLGSRKGDFLIRLWDQRLLALECKVSNSTVNSVKRVNNDAAVKAVSWRKEFGDRQVVPAAMLGGVFKTSNLIEAQECGLTIFWAHDLDTFVKWIQKTKSETPARKRKGP